MREAARRPHRPRNTRPPSSSPAGRQLMALMIRPAQPTVRGGGISIAACRLHHRHGAQRVCGRPSGAASQRSGCSGRQLLPSSSLQISPSLPRRPRTRHKQWVHADGVRGKQLATKCCLAEEAGQQRLPAHWEALGSTGRVRCRERCARSTGSSSLHARCDGVDGAATVCGCTAASCPRRKQMNRQNRPFPLT